jgi:CheY-like chemotaxis protein
MASVGILAAGVAHEINNPLASVIANLSLAIRDLADVSNQQGETALRDLQDELSDARDSAERIRNIVRDLKLFSRADDDQRGPVDVRRVLESSLRMAWNEIRHRARLIKNYAAVPAINANESRLGQVFLNLIVNAAQSMPEGRAEANEIRVATSVGPGGSVLVEISDTGSGMGPDVIKRLFTPFFTTKPVGVGTGLGLSICHRIITSIGGQIEVESTLGVGSTFKVVLPVIATSFETLEPAPGAIRAAVRRGRVLVIDDEPMIANVVRKTLAHDHDVTTVNRAQDALAKVLSGERFDVILCDLMMPEMTGMDLHAELVQSAPEQADQMIFLTGGAFTARARAFLDQATNLRVEKPFDTVALRAIVNDRVK